MLLYNFRVVIMLGKYELAVLGLDIILLLLVAFGALNFITFAIIIAIMATVIFIQKVELTDQVNELKEKYESLSKIFFSRMDDISKDLVGIKVEINRKLLEIGNKLSYKFTEEAENRESSTRDLMSKIIDVENKVSSLSKDLKSELEAQKIRIKRIEFELGLTEDEHIGE